jgi:hypothetical protein
MPDKAHFNYGGPDRWRPNISQSPWEGKMQDAMESYSCPAGSVLIFTESLIHASNDWLLPNPRVAIFNCCEYHCRAVQSSARTIFTSCFTT